MAAQDDKGRQAALADLVRLRAVAAGDEAAFARLVDEHGPVLLRFADRVLGGLPDAEDVVQETMIRLWEAAPTWQPQARITTWLHTVCYNKSVDRLRRRRNVADVAELDEHEDPGLHPEGELLRGEAVASVRAAIERLPHRHRTAVLLFHFQDLSQSESAAVMDLSESAFESLLARARRQLRTLLGPDATAGGDHG